MRERRTLTRANSAATKKPLRSTSANTAIRPSPVDIPSPPFRHGFHASGRPTAPVASFLRRQQGTDGCRDAGREKRHIVVGAELPTRVDQVEPGRVLRVLSRLGGWLHIDPIGLPDAREHGTWGGEIVPVRALPAGKRRKVTHRPWRVPFRSNADR